MTTNAFAQTNTERLTEVVDNTRSANTMLASIQELLTSLISDVMEAIAALAANIEAMSTNMSEDFDAVDDAISHVDEELSALDSKVMALDSTLMDISTQVSSVGDQVAAFDQRDAQADGYYQDNIDNFAVILPAIKETVDQLAASQSGGALASISEGVSANAARINEITTSLEVISTQLSTIQEELDIVANTTATAVTTAQTRAPLTGPSPGSATLEISPYDIAKNVNDDGDMAKVTYSFMCEEDIFIQSIGRVRASEAAIGIGAEDLAGLDDIDSDAADRVDKVTVSVSGAVSGPLYDSAFEGTGTVQRYDNSLMGNNAPLLAGKTLTIVLTANEDALANTVNFNGAVMIYPKSDTANTPAPEITTIGQLAGNLSKQLHNTTGASDSVQDSDSLISAQTLTPTIYELKVSWISDAEDAKCEFMRTDETTDTSTVYMSFKPEGDDVLNMDKMVLNCNDVDATIVSINPIMAGDLKQTATLKFLDADNEPRAIFGFDVNGTHSLKDGFEDALPLKWDGDDLTIEATLSKLTTLFLQVDYQSADGNRCTATDPDN